ncbi:asparagine--tRNA ligase, cytoplasmic 2-like [Abrus precatorius]|uniref:Asparagine--tRNA ligase, cytoplasmic 2-like n=1 Tax=Abrus precatorius TaxID=3816 RepID=A0A8B8K005_ABRPR|nr:asparagine--tRNA ligase, cytoplasmic 2-like [Abrus precatorius]
MGTQEYYTPSPVTPLNYSNRVQVKTLLHKPQNVVGQRVVVGGWVKFAREVDMSSSPSVDGTRRNKDMSLVEILQSQIPLIGNILEIIGGSSCCHRKKREPSGPSKVVPPKPSTALLLLSDGSCVGNLKVVVDSSVATPRQLLATGTCILVEGQLQRPSSEEKHAIELKVDKVLHIGTVDFDKYPLSKKEIPPEMLRECPQFRPRTTTVATVMRVRSALSFAIHSFFHKHEFIEVQIPTITTADCEGFSNMFQVTTLNQKAEKQNLNTIYESEGVNLEVLKAAAKEKSNLVEQLKRSESNREALAAAVQDLRKTNELASQLEAREKKKLGAYLKDDKVDSSKDFFHSQTYLTVSGRLHLESCACALGNIYSFGPRFQADKTDSPKLAAEMWVVEVEMAFSQLKDSMNCANDLFKYLCKWVLENCSEDMNFVSERINKDCINRLQQIISGSPKTMSYNEAIDLSSQAEDKKFEPSFESGVVLTSEHLSYLADSIYKKPIMIYNYPKEAKPFYVRQNDDGTVDAFDLIVPKVGTIISGSQNEERLNLISSRINDLGLPREKYEWYLDLRQNGTVKHSGFSLRFDLMVLFATGLLNVRDVIPFPRSYGKPNN